MKEISFVDKIVFGKWNYNHLVGYFKDYKNFYNNTSQEVIDFCEKKGIEVHIKEGTMLSNKNDYQKTCPQFIKTPKQIPLFNK